MVKHMIIWKFKEEVQDREAKKAAIKEALEGLVGKIDGLLSMTIFTAPLPSSNGDLMMDSTFENEEALLLYRDHPLHVKVADTLVRPVMASRLAMDYET